MSNYPRITERNTQALENLTRNGSSFVQGVLEREEQKRLQPLRVYKKMIRDNFDTSFIVDEIMSLGNITKLEMVRVAKDITEQQISELRDEIILSGNYWLGVQSTPLGKFVYYRVPDAQAKAKAIDMIIKLKGEYAPEKVDMRMNMPARIIGSRIVDMTIASLERAEELRVIAQEKYEEQSELIENNDNDENSSEQIENEIEVT